MLAYWHGVVEMVFTKNYETPQQQDGVSKYIYLHPWALWSFGLSWRGFCPDARFCGARLFVSGRLGRRAGILS